MRPLLLCFCILVFSSCGAQSFEQLPQKINITNYQDSRLYHTCRAGGGWVSAGRALDTVSASAAALLYFHFSETQDSLIWFRGDFDCRLYTVIPDSDSTILAGGYIRYPGGGERSFISRWSGKGQLIDSLSFCVGDAAFNIITTFQKDKQGVVYAWCKAGEEEKGFPWLLQLGAGLGPVVSTRIPIEVGTGGVARSFVFDERDDVFFCSIPGVDRSVLAKLDKRGKLLDSTGMVTGRGYYRPGDKYKLGYEFKYGVDPNEITIWNDKILIIGDSGDNIFLGSYDKNLKLLQANRLYSPFTEEGFGFYIRENICWIGGLVRHSGYPEFYYKAIAFNDTLACVRNLFTGYRAAATSIVRWNDQKVLLTGFRNEGDITYPFQALFEYPAIETEIQMHKVFRSLEGPPGADATAFTIDRKGNYWLGTGSSGGVYFSKDRGNTWTPRLKGLGAMHITALYAQADTVWARVEDIRLKDLPVPVSTEIAFFYYTGKSKQWKWMEDEKRSQALRRQMRRENFRLFNIYQENYPLDKTDQSYSRLMTHYKGFGVDLRNETFDIYESEVATRMGGFHPVDSSLEILNKSFPPDVFEVDRNITLDKNRLILLAKSGVYYSDEKGPLYNGSRNGLYATDVRLLRRRKNNDLIALVGTQEIWRRRSDNWQMIFSTHDFFRRFGKREDDTGLDIVSFELTSGDEIIFPVGSDIWRLDTNDSLHLVLKHGNHLNEEGGNINFFGGTRVRNGEFYLIGVSSRDNKFGLFRIKDSVTLLREFDETFTYFYTDRQGNTWLMGDSIYRFDPAKEEGMLEAMALRQGAVYPSQISSNDKGNVAVMSGYGVLVWKPETGEWIPLSIETDEAELYRTDSYRRFTSVAIDENENLYFGSSPTYSVYCGFVTIGHPEGVFSFNGYQVRPVTNGINNWVYALEFDASKQLCAGTSGSGVIRMEENISTPKKKKKRFLFF